MVWKRWLRQFLNRVLGLSEKVEYLEHEVSRLSEAVRKLEISAPQSAQTRASFSFQWDRIPAGAALLADPEFRNEATQLVIEYTGLPASWFVGKRVVDVGCGTGRYSWALSKLGATVLSLDQSEEALVATRKACAEFPGHATMRVSLLEPLPIEEKFDLVWSFGVLHHTGDTRGAFARVAKLAKPGGKLFVMLYGEPRPDRLSDYAEVNEYHRWRKRTRHLNFDGKLDAILEGIRHGEFRANDERFAHGYFDAISPLINDLHNMEEIREWMIEEGFEGIERRNDDNRNHFVAAQKLS